MKRVLYKLKVLVVTMAMSAGLLSCSGEWLELYPEGETLLEDYWKTGSDVEAVVASCYRALIESTCIERMVVWGELRSDDMVAGSSVSAAQQNLLDVNILADNTYADWSCFYTVINYCNTVLYYAPQVVDIDGSFSVNQMNAYRAEALSIRALCYFYLVRTFRDVPLRLEPVIDDTEEFDIAKTSGKEILDRMITDLQEAKVYAQTSYGGVVEYNKGRFTKQAVRALLADIYLWQGMYQECIDECDEFLYNNNALVKTEQLSLITSDFMSEEIYMRGNSNESILELQFTTGGLSNSAVSDLYGMSDKSQLSALYSLADLFPSTDIRKNQLMYTVSSYTMITKYINSVTKTSSGEYTLSGRSTATMNWILYRLPDIYLMKAEALVEVAENNDNNMQEAIILLNKTYKRANPDMLLADTLNIRSYGSQYAMRNLILEERQREFMYEGKRWFDLVRLSEREGSTTSLIDLVAPKFAMSASDYALAVSKMSTIDALYMPISKSEMTSNKLMVQNPFYKMDETSVVN